MGLYGIPSSESGRDRHGKIAGKYFSLFKATVSRLKRSWVCCNNEIVSISGLKRADFTKEYCAVSTCIPGRATITITTYSNKIIRTSFRHLSIASCCDICAAR